MGPREEHSRCRAATSSGSQAMGLLATMRVSDRELLPYFSPKGRVPAVEPFAVVGLDVACALFDAAGCMRRCGPPFAP